MTNLFPWPFFHQIFKKLVCLGLLSFLFQNTIKQFRKNLFYVLKTIVKMHFFPPNTIIYLSLVLSYLHQHYYLFKQYIDVPFVFLAAICNHLCPLPQIFLWGETCYIFVTQRLIFSIKSKQQKKTHCKFVVSLMLYDLTNPNGCNSMMFGQKSGKFWNWNFSDTFMNCKTTDTFWCLDRIKSLFK